MKKIVVLDAYTLNPLPIGEESPLHPSWQALASLGELTLYPRTSENEVVSRCADADIVLTNKAPITAIHLDSLPKLSYIGVLATGTNIVNLAAARRLNIPVTNAPGYSTMSVAQHVFALLFELAARTGETDRAVKNGDWVRCPDFCFTVAPFFEMAGKNLGIVGFGEIGQAVARIGAALGMNILVHSRTQKPFEVPVEWVDLDGLWKEADVITLHCPLTEGTKGLVNSSSLAKMKNTAYLINTGRGALINEGDLASALQYGRLGGFGADVLSKEPPAADNPLLSAPNTVITPHIAWASVEARRRLMAIVAGNVEAFLAGHPTNVVN
jgi:glycerate dehydrogenase